MNKTRIKKVTDLMNKFKLDQIIISNPASIFYLTGIWIHPGERLVALFINKNGENIFFNNELFPIRNDIGAEIVWYNDAQDPIEKMKNYINTSKIIGIDGEWKSKFLINLMKVCQCNSFINSSFILDTIRAEKDDDEKVLMREASRLNDLAMEKIQLEIRENITEKYLMKKLQTIYEEIGADGFSFNPIIAFGKNSANPHHDTGNSTLEWGDSIIIDIGCVKDSYISDMTRTVFFKKVGNREREIYEIVKKAQQMAIDKIKPGVKFSDVDYAARNYIVERGYGKFFTHRTGHCAGIEVHDFGDVSETNQDIIKSGMVFSIEPGIYLSGEVGVRIEDLVLVTDDGCEVLNKISKEIKIIK
ncbi:MAG: M24 family metallopeptidase [Filifactoraceae bacterium]